MFGGEIVLPAGLDRTDQHQRGDPEKAVPNRLTDIQFDEFLSLFRVPHAGFLRNECRH